MSVRKHDYVALEREYVNHPTLSIRALCKKHDIKGYSSVAAYAREHDWDPKRARIQERKEDKMVERVAERMADQELALVDVVREEWLTVIRAATYKFAEDLKDPNYKVRVPDLISLIDKGLVLLGEPSSRTEERHLAITGSLEGLPDSFIRQLADVTRPQLAAGRGEGIDPRMGAEKARQN